MEGSTEQSVVDTNNVGADPVVVGGGTSYDDILAMVSDQAPADDSGETGTDQPEQGTEAKQAEKAAEEKKPEPEKKETAGVITAKGKDGKDLELSEDTEFTTKVDGVDQKVTLKQLLRHEQIDLRFNKKMNEVNEERKKVEGERREVEGFKTKLQNEVQQIASVMVSAKKAITAGDLDQAIPLLAKIISVPPKELHKQLRSRFLSNAEQWLQADESKRKTLELEEDSAYDRRELEESQQERAVDSKVKQYDAYAFQTMTEAGLTRDEFLQARFAVNSQFLQGQDLDLKRATPDQVRQYVEAIVIQAHNTRVGSQAEQTIAKVAPELRETDPEEFERISEIVRPFVGQYAEEDILEVVKSAIGSSAATPAAKGSKEQAVHSSTNQASKPRSESLASSENEDEDLERAKRQVDEDPLSVYGR